MKKFPGSVIDKTDITGKQFLDGMFGGASGMVMSQVKELTGLSAPAIQNWINRKWLSHPQGKRYNEDQVARILIINMLRKTMSLEDITKLLFYVNGVAGDYRDDIIAESELYGYICEIVFSNADEGSVDKIISDTVKPFRERRVGDVNKLKTALKIIYLNHIAGEYIDKSEELLSQVK
jgi:DNA-binding transcriptional MerR regulator